MLHYYLLTTSSLSLQHRGRKTAAALATPTTVLPTPLQKNAKSLHATSLCYSVLSYK